MDRVATLNEDEYKVLKLIRSIQSRAVSGAIRHRASSDLRRELEDIYNILTTTDSHMREEAWSDITQRIYRMLY